MARDCGFGSGGKKKRTNLKRLRLLDIKPELELKLMASIAACINGIEKLIFRRHEYL